MKRVFKIQTNYHMNGAPGQDWEIHQWLIALLEEIARKTARKDDPNCQGKTVDVIVEVLE